MTHPGRPGGLLCSWITTPTPGHPPHHHTRQDHTNTNRDTPRAPWWPSLLMDRHTHTRTPTTPPHPPGSHRHQQRHNRGARPPYKSHQDPGHLGQIHTQPNTGGGLVGLRRGPGAYLPGPPGGGAGEPQRLWRRVADERVGFWVKFELLFALIFRELGARFGRVSTKGSVWISECYDQKVGALEKIQF